MPASEAIRYFSRILLGSSILVSGCVNTSQGKGRQITPAQYHAERAKDIDAMSDLLYAIKEGMFNQSDYFDHCFMNGKTRIDTKNVRAGVLVEGPVDGKLSLSTIATPIESGDYREFKRCVRVAINRVDVRQSHRPMKNLAFSIQPSWAELSMTTFEPSKAQIPPKEVCMFFERGFNTIKSRDWDVQKYGHQYATDNVVKLGSEDTWVCSNQNLHQALAIDPEKIKRQYATGDLSESEIVDGLW